MVFGTVTFEKLPVHLSVVGAAIFERGKELVGIFNPKVPEITHQGIHIAAKKGRHVVAENPKTFVSLISLGG